MMLTPNLGAGNAAGDVTLKMKLNTLKTTQMSIDTGSNTSLKIKTESAASSYLMIIWITGASEATLTTRSNIIGQ